MPPLFKMPMSPIQFIVLSAGCEPSCWFAAVSLVIKNQELPCFSQPHLAQDAPGDETPACIRRANLLHLTCFGCRCFLFLALVQQTVGNIFFLRSCLLVLRTEVKSGCRSMFSNALRVGCGKWGFNKCHLFGPCFWTLITCQLLTNF